MMGGRNEQKWDAPVQRWHQNVPTQQKEEGRPGSLMRANRSESLREVVNSVVLSKWPSRRRNLLNNDGSKNNRKEALRRSVSNQSEHAFEEVEKKTISLLWPILAPFLTTSKWWNMVVFLCGLLACLFSVTKETKSWNPYKEDHPYLFKFDWCKSSLACAQSPLERFFGVVARFTGGAIYGVLAFTLSTMAHATTNILGRSPQVLLSPGLFGTSHVRHAHVGGGKAILNLSIAHGLFHIARWAVRSELRWAMSSAMVIVGCIALVGFLAIGPVSARKNFIEKCINFCCCCLLRTKNSDLSLTEVTTKPQSFKIDHENWMLLAHHCPVLIAVIMAALHHPRLAVVSSCFVFIWLADRLYLTLFRTYLVEAPHLVAINDHDLPSGTLISFNNPDNFDYVTGDYVQIRLPWLEGHLGHQYHPFSLAPIGDKAKQRSMLFCAASGDWTRALHANIQRAGDGFGRPMLLTGPYTAPFNTSVKNNFVLVVASGIGITPCLAVLERYGSTRNVVVLWISRDAALLRLYSNYLDRSFCRRAVVYYTGKLPTKDFNKLRDDLKPLHVRAGRPDIKRIVTKIVTNTYVSEDSRSTLYSQSGDEEDGVEEVLIGDSSAIADEEEMNKSFERFESDISSEIARPLPVRPLEPLWTPPKLTSLSEEGEVISPRALSNNPLPNLDHHKEFLRATSMGSPIEPEEWRVLYCGGSRKIGETLETCCKITGASYAAESFWL